MTPPRVILITQARDVTSDAVMAWLGRWGVPARRLNVEFVPHLFLVDRDGKIAGLRLYVDDAEEVDHTREFIERTLGAK